MAYYDQEGGMQFRTKGQGLILFMGAGAFLLFSVAGNGNGGFFALQTEEARTIQISFDRGIDPALVSKLSSAGDILVKPMIGDREVGWFRIDPASEGMRILPSVAEDLAWTESGTHRFISTSAAEDRRAWICPVLRLGPCRAEALEMTEMKAAGDEGTDESVVGVVGTALLRAVVVEFDLGEIAVRLYDPSSYDNPRADWREFRSQYSLPVIRCRFEGESEGDFGLDLRTPLAIVFFKPAVDALDLLRDRVTRPGTISGVNFGQASVRTGILLWFDAAGVRSEKVQAVFLTQDVALPAAKDLTGLLGRDVLKGGTLVLDYSRSRMAVVSSF